VSFENVTLTEGTTFSLCLHSTFIVLFQYLTFLLSLKIFITLIYICYIYIADDQVQDNQQSVPVENEAKGILKLDYTELT